MGRALQDRLLQRPLRALIDVLGREAALGLGALGDRLFQIALVGVAAIEDAGFVEMDVGLDEAGGDQPSTEIDGFTFSRQRGCECDDLAVVDADIGKPVFGTNKSRISEESDPWSPCWFGSPADGLSEDDRAIHALLPHGQAYAIDGGMRPHLRHRPNGVFLLDLTVKATR